MTTYPAIIASESFPATPATLPFSVVLRDFGPSAPHRYVTHCRNDDARASYHYWGHYFEDLSEARADFAARCLKYRR